MALIKCPECGKEVSDTCEHCIHCGYQLKKPTNTETKPFISDDTESLANKTYLRDAYHRWIGGIVAGVFCIIFAVVFFILSAIPAVTAGIGSIIAIFIVFGFVLLGAGIAAIIYYKHRIDTY